MKEYQSEKGTFYLIAIIIAIVLLLPLLIVRYNPVSSQERLAVILAYVIAAAAYFFSIIYPILNTRYIIKDKTLVIKSGFYKNDISCDKIIEITPGKSFQREPALSSSRLYVKYRDGQLIKTVGISPKNKEDFIKSLQL
ncbi:PH domain-containing protein [Diplocloster modestus]|uniref:PH domain-containing protein n=1 Tax=Diplocloster modestus TaxID=2850322 RepID=A0ABS6KD04_9FIRM|nr:PH domain-containing protein [Diplocloster modestus]MBU9728381.1 PH domain-containing protein [Diplocloster modestus]